MDELAASGSGTNKDVDGGKFLKEFAEEQTSEEEFGEKNRSLLEVHGSDIKGEQDEEKVNLAEKYLSDRDVSHLNRLVIAATNAEYSPFPDIIGTTPKVLSFEDEDGKPWRFRCSYYVQRYFFTKGWSAYVREKKLCAGDFVFFQQHRMDSNRLFIGRIRRNRGDAALGKLDYVLPDPTSLVTSSETFELREIHKKVETPLQLRLHEHSITGFDPILVIFCGENQDSEEAFFISHIVGELCRQGFTPFRYDITRSTMAANQEMLHRSRFGIMIVSENYVRSRECLNEFVAIVKHLKKSNIITVSFEVSHANRAVPRFGNLVQASHVPKWGRAMQHLYSVNKYQYTKGSEVLLAKDIVRDVSLLLHSETNNKLKGMRIQLKSILSLLHGSRCSAPQIIGLWGMAGIGKTTITREIFRTQAERYDVCFFLADFHMMCQTKGLSHLRDEFYSKIFGEENGFIDSCDTKLSFTRDRFLDKRVLVILDGVTSARDAEYLLGGFGWFSGGHTIMLTSRNRQVLVQCKVKALYEIPKLSESESFHVCSQYVTEQNWKARISLISELVNYASGIPLALRVLGSSIQKQCKNGKQLLRSLRQHPPMEIQDALRRSFDGLDENEIIFLDLACFFRGENKDYVVNILDSCGLLTDLGIYGLIDESLISLVDNKIEMPNIFQDTGRFVVCQEHKEAGKRSRLWNSNDIVDVLTNNTGTEAIEGIFLNASGLTCELSPTVFERMYRLRFLKLHCPTSEYHCKVCLPQGLHSLPDELRLLHWERYPLGSLPRNFHPKNLVELNMPYSNMTKLWKGTKNVKKLQRIILKHSRHFSKFPRLSEARNLLHIDLEGCTSLVKVNSSILHHHKINFLSLKDCSQLQIMPTTVHLESLEVLNLSGCSELKNLQDFSPNLKHLYLAGTAITEIPSSIGNLTRLVTLDLENCKRLQHLPPGISNLRAMVTLKLSGCSNLKSLPNLDALFLRDSYRPNTNVTPEESVPLKFHSAIQERSDGSEILLNLDNLKLRSDIQGSSCSSDVEVLLPASDYLSRDGIPQEIWPRVINIPFTSSVLHSLASRLYALVSLYLCNAYLVDIPEDLCRLASVETLDLSGNPFSQIPKNIKELCKLHSLRLRHCKNLRSLPELPRSLEILNAHGCVSLISFPSSFEKFPRDYTFSNCFALPPEIIRKSIGKALEGFRQEHINPPSFSICTPASTGQESLHTLQAGSSVRIELTPDMRRTTSGFALSVVVEFWNNYYSASGFGIKCICKHYKALVHDVSDSGRVDVLDYIDDSSVSWDSVRDDVPDVPDVHDVPDSISFGSKHGETERKRYTPWTEKENKLKRSTSRNVVRRTTKQVARHALKDFLRRNLVKERKRSSIHDIKGELSSRQERIFYFWPPKEAPTIQKDHMFVFSIAKMHDFLADIVTFEFHPVNWENDLLDGSCSVKRCGVWLIPTTAGDMTLGTKHHSSSVDSEEPSSVGQMAPPFKRCRVKRDIEIVILTIRKRKRENSVTKAINLAKRQRRVQISGRLKKLQELVPNMDKQTNTTDMLDVAVDYIKDLEREHKILKENKANCKCRNKEKKAV